MFGTGAKRGCIGNGDRPTAGAIDLVGTYAAGAVKPVAVGRYTGGAADGFAGLATTAA